MKFIEISKVENLKKETLENFEAELNKFKLKYKDYNFSLLFPDEFHLIVQLDCSDDFCEAIHNDLCETFDVNLHYVNHWQQENPLTVKRCIELIYTPKHHYVDNFNWEDIVLAKEIKFK